MAGHSKWANIKHRKGAQDAKRAKIFTRIIKEISVAVKEGNTDPSSNSRLRTAIANAKAVNLPKDRIEKAIKKASGNDATDFVEVNFEGYAPNGVAVFVECTTDNTNRTVANVRAIFNKHGGSLGKNGSLEFVFDRKGVITLNKSSVSMPTEELEMTLIDYGLEELDEEGGLIQIYTEFESFGACQSQLEAMEIPAESAELQRIPTTTVSLETPDAKKILKMIDKFEEDEDVQNVFHNLEITDELAAEMEGEA